MIRLSNALAQWLRPAILFPNRTGVAVDPMVPMGAFIHNANLASPAPVTKTGEPVDDDVKLTAEEVMRGVIFLDVEPSGGTEKAFKVSLPSTDSILATFGNVLLTDGSWAREFKVVNQSCGHAVHLTPADEQTTITGPDKVECDWVRTWLMTITSGTTINFRNLGMVELKEPEEVEGSSRSKRHR